MERKRGIYVEEDEILGDGAGVREGGGRGDRERGRDKIT